MTWLRVVVTGGRNYSDEDTVRRVLDELMPGSYRSGWCFRG